MAPALTSEVVLQGRLEHSITSRELGKRRHMKSDKFHQTTSKAILSIVRSKIRYKRRSFSSVKYVSELNVARKDILKLSKNMNPNHVSSGRSDSINVPVKKLVNTAKMCGGTENGSSGCSSATNSKQATELDTALPVSQAENMGSRCEHSDSAPSTSHENVRNRFDSELEILSHERALRRHSMLTRRAAKLESRIRRLQSKQAVSHARREVRGLVDNQKQHVVRTEFADDSTLDLKGAQNMSTSALVTLVQKWQAQQPHSRKTSKQVNCTKPCNRQVVTVTQNVFKGSTVLRRLVKSIYM